MARADFDSPWKEALEQFFQPFMELCFPRSAALLDWTQPVEFLDKELQSVVRDAESGRRYVDKLVRVFRRDGAVQRVLVHLEIQTQPDPKLSKRMFDYYSLLRVAHSEQVVSMAVLADSTVEWRSGPYEEEGLECELWFNFPRCKLADFPDQFLEDSENPIAKVVAAHRAAQRTAQDSQRRSHLKWERVRELYRRGWDRDRILRLYRLIDWLMPLPPLDEIDFLGKLRELEQKQVMPYVTNAERIGLERGLQRGMEEGRVLGLSQGLSEGLTQGLSQGLSQGLTQGLSQAIREVALARWGSLPIPLEERLKTEGNLDTLRCWLRLAGTASSLEELDRAIAG